MVPDRELEVLGRLLEVGSSRCFRVNTVSEGQGTAPGGGGGVEGGVKQQAMGCMCAVGMAQTIQVVIVGR